MSDRLLGFVILGLLQGEWAAIAGLPFVFALYLARRALFQWVCLVQIDSSGALTFKTVMSTTRITAADILRVDISMPLIGGEDCDNREVLIVHSGGKLTIPYSKTARVDRVISELTRLNPSIDIVRKW